MKTNSFQKIAFSSFVVGLFVLFSWYKILPMEPVGANVWRQTDGLTIAQGYFYDDQPFFEPKTNDYREGLSDITLTEFPLFYYITGKIWALTGEQPWVLRSINLLIWILGLWYLYKFTYLMTKSNLKSFTMLLLVCSSSLLSHYSLSFIPNTPALALLFIGVYFNYMALVNKKYSTLFLSAFILLAAVLVKVTMALPLIIYGVFLLLKLLQTRNIQYVKNGLSLIAVFAFTYSWVKYVEVYNGEVATGKLLENFSVFKNGWPNFSELKSELLIHLRTFGSYELLWTLSVCFFILIVHLVKNRKWKGLFMLSLMALGLVFYVLTFFYGLVYHDYYWVILEAGIVFCFLLFLYYVTIKPWWLQVGLTFMLGFTLLQSAGSVTTRNIANYNFYQRQLVSLVSEEDAKLNEYFRYVSSQDWVLKSKYRGVMDSLSITRSSPVIVYPEWSTNIPLYYLNLRGKTDFHHHNTVELHKRFQKLEDGTEKREGYEYFIYLKGKNDAYDAEVKALSLDAIFEDSTLIVYKL